MASWARFGVVNQLVYEYNDLGQVNKSRQDHDSVVAGTGLATADVLYSFDDDAASNIFTDGMRLESMTYPNGRVLNYDYGADHDYRPGSNESNDNDDGVADRLHRVAKMWEYDGTKTFTLAEYMRTGIGRHIDTAVHRVYTGDEEPQTLPDALLHYRLRDGYGGDYYGLDTFGRIQNLLWTNAAKSATHVQIEHGHDFNSNRTWREDDMADAADKHIDELYAYDGLRGQAFILHFRPFGG